jgi:hypothetical protein
MVARGTARGAATTSHQPDLSSLPSQLESSQVITMFQVSEEYRLRALLRVFLGEVSAGSGRHAVLPALMATMHGD